MERKPWRDWRPVPGFEGLYEVSDCGDVRALACIRTNTKQRRFFPGKMMSAAARQHRYATVAFWSSDGQRREQWRLHVLVATVFVPNPNGLPCVRHWDDDKTNNHASNLRWGTLADNMHDKVRNGRAGRVLTLDDVVSIKRLLIQRRATETYRTQDGFYKELCAQYGISYSTLHHIETGRTWRHAKPD